MRAYAKLARLAARLAARDGLLLLCSCSQQVSSEEFGEAVRRGLAAAERRARLLRTGSAGPDHPVLAALPESAYLKALLFAL